MIKNLIFDFGKVLVDYDFEAFFKEHVPDVERRQELTPLLYNEGFNANLTGKKSLSMKSWKMWSIRTKVLNRKSVFSRCIILRLLPGKSKE